MKQAKKEEEVEMEMYNDADNDGKSLRSSVGALLSLLLVPDDWRIDWLPGVVEEEEIAEADVVKGK
jgi:hypothetical protein